MSGPQTLEIGLAAAVVAVKADTPLILVTPKPAHEAGEGSDGLPFGPFDPLAHRTFEMGLRGFVAEQTGFDLGYVEQLYTFGDRGRHARPGDTGPHAVSVGYVALTRPRDAGGASGVGWRSWYGYFPWEDMREGRSPLLDREILPLLNAWAAEPPRAEERGRPLARPERVRLLFGQGGLKWDEEKVLDRYECLYEAGLVIEARRDGREAALRRSTLPRLGEPMRFDHRRILATAIGRLRAKLKYRPLVFEMMPQTFTLTELQRTVEAVHGAHLHKQNFRRLVEASELVEPTGAMSSATGGRPAALYRFRREVLRERPTPGLRVSVRG